MFWETKRLSHVDEDHSAPSTPKRSRKMQSSSKNPYSRRGLDKFSMVLAELEAKREKIMAKTGYRDDTMVRFMYSNSKDWVPIIIKPREPKQDDTTTKPAAEVKQLLPTPPSPENQNGSEVVKQSKEVVKKEGRKVKKSFSWDPYYWPVVMVLVLVCLMFGRVFAICWITVWWYMVPIMKGWGSGNLRRKEYGKRLSDKRLGGNLGVSPFSSFSSSQGKKMEGGLASPRAQVKGKRG